MKKITRIASLLLAFIMLLSLMSVQAFAQELQPEELSADEVLPEPVEEAAEVQDEPEDIPVPEAEDGQTPAPSDSQLTIDTYPVGLPTPTNVVFDKLNISFSYTPADGNAVHVALDIYDASGKTVITHFHEFPADMSPDFTVNLARSARDIETLENGTYITRLYLYDEFNMLRTEFVNSEPWEYVKPTVSLAAPEAPVFLENGKAVIHIPENLDINMADELWINLYYSEDGSNFRRIMGSGFPTKYGDIVPGTDYTTYFSMLNANVRDRNGSGHYRLTAYFITKDIEVILSSEESPSSNIIYFDKDRFPAEITYFKKTADGDLIFHETVSGYIGQSKVIDVAEPYLEGYEFLGWTDEDKGTVVKYKTGDSIILNDVDTYLYAVFNPIEEPAPEGTWMLDDNGWWYQYSDGSFPAGDWAQINGSWYLFDENGYAENGWVYLPRVESYGYFRDGAPSLGWDYIDGYCYYFGNNGNMRVGEQCIDGSWFYFHPDGHMASDEVIDGYYYDASGYRQEGSAGLVGEVPEMGYRYPDGSWAYNEWKIVNGNYYYFNEYGCAEAGWFDYWGTWYYFDEQSCIMQRGWLLNNGHYYFFSDSGAMLTGPQEINGSYYYFYDDGVMATDVWIDGDFYSPGGNMYTDCWMGEAPYWWYQLRDGSYYHDCFQTIDGWTYYFQSNGYILFEDWLKQGNDWYYFDYEGHMLKDTVWEHNNEYYHFDAEGKLFLVEPAV